ncbi:hypothetical protein [Mythimna sequax nucleopolyhedrovirus]|nr:hypothetical protein [Mythimna sequax nucleopolyhedrovirus]
MILAKHIKLTCTNLDLKKHVSPKQSLITLSNKNKLRHVTKLDLVKHVFSKQRLMQLNDKQLTSFNQC